MKCIVDGKPCECKDNLCKRHPTKETPDVEKPKPPIDGDYLRYMI